jgi:hypothetical protein
MTMIGVNTAVLATLLGVCYSLVPTAVQLSHAS